MFLSRLSEDILNGYFVLIGEQSKIGGCESGFNVWLPAFTVRNIYIINKKPPFTYWFQHSQEVYEQCMCLNTAFVVRSSQSFVHSWEADVEFIRGSEGSAAEKKNTGCGGEMEVIHRGTCDHSTQKEVRIHAPMLFVMVYYWDNTFHHNGRKELLTQKTDDLLQY